MPQFGWPSIKKLKLIPESPYCISPGLPAGPSPGPERRCAGSGQSPPAMIKFVFVLMEHFLKSLIMAVLFLGLISADPLDIGGIYNRASVARCHSGPWSCNGAQSCCTTEGCVYQEQLKMTSPSADGSISATVTAADQSCYTGSMGPWKLSVDTCGRVMGGFNFATKSSFDHSLTDQDLDLFVMGWVQGFNGAPPGYRYTTVTRQNVTICDSGAFVQGTCTLGRERFVCYEDFAVCSGGDCAGRNLNILSPASDAFFARFSTTGLNGTYDLQVLRPEMARASSQGGRTMTCETAGR